MHETSEATLKQRPGDQPLPVPNDRPDIQSLVIADITARREVGIQRYGSALQPHNGRDSHRDLYEELLDACMYIKQVMVERADKRAAAVEAVALMSPRDKHSQMCPYWRGRAKNVGLDKCNCWIVRNAGRVVDTVLAALAQPAEGASAGEACGLNGHEGLRHELEAARGKLGQLCAYVEWCAAAEVETDGRDIIAILDGREAEDYGARLNDLERKGQTDA